MITATIAVLFILLMKTCCSMALIVYPTIVGGLSAANWCTYIAICTYDYNGIGNMVNSFTELQPIDVYAYFYGLSFIIISPLSQLR